MAFDGSAEAEAIITRLEGAGTVLEDIGPDTVLPVDFAENPLPYMVVEFGSPVPAARGRGVGVDEQGQPYVFPFQITFICKSRSLVRELRAAADAQIVGWVPVAGNSTEVKAAGGFIPPSLNVQTTPAESRLIRWYTVGINGVVEQL